MNPEAFENLTEIIVPIGFFTAIAISLYFYLKTRHKERMTLIEKGIDLSQFYTKKKNGNNILKYALLFIGFSLGLFIGFLLDMYTKVQSEVAYFSMIFLFGGISLLVYYFINSKQINK